jgi:hypothetical protein
MAVSLENQQRNSAVAQDKSAIIQRAQECAARGQFDQAIVQWEKLLAGTAEDGTIHNNIGDLHQKANKPGDAVAAYFNAAKAFRMGDGGLKAAAVYKKILKIDPKHFDAQRGLAELNVERGLVKPAALDYLALAKMYEKAGKPAETMEAYRKVSELDPSNRAAAEWLQKHVTKPAEEPKPHEPPPPPSGEPAAEPAPAKRGSKISFSDTGSFLVEGTVGGFMSAYDEHEKSESASAAAPERELSQEEPASEQPSIPETTSAAAGSGAVLAEEAAVGDGDAESGMMVAQEGVDAESAQEGETAATAIAEFPPEPAQETEAGASGLTFAFAAASSAESGSSSHETEEAVPQSVESPAPQPATLFRFASSSSATNEPEPTAAAEADASSVPSHGDGEDEPLLTIASFDTPSSEEDDQKESKKQ